MKMRVFWVFLGLLILAGCAEHQVRLPANDPAPRAVPTLAESEINVPVALNLQSVRADVLQHLPKPLLAGQSSKQTAIAALGGLNVAVQTEYRLTLDDLQLQVVHHALQLQVVADVSARASMAGPLGHASLAGCGYGEPPARIRFSLDGNLSVQQQGGVSVQPGAWKMDWLRPCRITALNLDVGSLLSLPWIHDQVNQLVQNELTQALSADGVRSALMGVWPMLNQPVDMGHGLWLLLHPSDLALRQLDGTGSVVNLGLQLKARPEVMGEHPPVQPVPPLPALKPWASKPGFRVGLLFAMPLTKANALLNQSLAGRTLMVHGHQVLIRSVQVYGHADRAVLVLQLDQPFTGMIVLEATPVMDTQTGSLSFTQVDYALSTSSFLARTASWMLGHELRRQIELGLKVPLAPALQQLRQYAKAPLDMGHGLKAQLTLDDFRAQGLWFSPDQVHAVVGASGALQLYYGLDSSAARTLVP